MGCPIDPKDRYAYHATLREGDLATWRKLKYNCDQVVPEEGGLPGYTLELRDCECGSTIAREIGPTLRGGELTAHLRDIIERFVKGALAKSHRRTRRQDPYIVLEANIGTKVFLDQLAEAISDELEKDEGK